MQIEKPKWLKRLEKESWQAELIVSGIAIFGSLQLPGLIDNLMESCLTLFPEHVYFGLYMFFIYLLMAINVLIISLIAHFVVRALWIGLIGLNSVFPNGINPEHKTYSPYFMEKLIAEFPNDTNQITNLDHFCSVIFAFCSFLVLNFIAFTVDILILLFLYLFIVDYLPPGAGIVIISVFIFVVSVVSLMILLMNNKRFKGNKIVRKYQYPLYRTMTFVVFHIFRKLIVRLSFTFFSNLELKKYMKWTAGFTVVLMVVMFIQAIDSKLLYFTNKNNFHSIYDRSDRMRPENYLSSRTPAHGRILSAVLESDKISGEAMKVFVPVFSNEGIITDELCGEFSNSNNLEGDERRQAKRLFYSECLRKYHQFYLNDSLTQADISKYTHENRKEDGILAFIKTDALKEGLNVLKIEKIKNENSEIYRTMRIPFYFNKN